MRVAETCVPPYLVTEGKQCCQQAIGRLLWYAWQDMRWPYNVTFRRVLATIWWVCVCVCVCVYVWCVYVCVYVCVVCVCVVCVYVWCVCMCVCGVCMYVWCVCMCVWCVCVCVVCVCACVCSLSYAACIAHAPYCHLWPVQLYNIFPRYLIRGTI